MELYPHTHPENTTTATTPDGPHWPPSGPDGKLFLTMNTTIDPSLQKGQGRTAGQNDARKICVIRIVRSAWLGLLNFMEYQENPPTPPHPPSTLGALVIQGIIIHDIVRADSSGVCVWHAQADEIMEKVVLEAVEKARSDVSETEQQNGSSNGVAL